MLFMISATLIQALDPGRGHEEELSWVRDYDI